MTATPAAAPMATASARRMVCSSCANRATRAIVARAARSANRLLDFSTAVTLIKRDWRLQRAVLVEPGWARSLSQNERRRHAQLVGAVAHLAARVPAPAERVTRCGFDAARMRRAG